VAQICRKHTYSMNDIKYLKNISIIEYDMVDAGFSIIKENKLVDEKTIEVLGEMNKKDRLIKIGKMYIGNKTFSKAHILGFSNARCAFVKKNKIKNSEILSIKKDAVFLIGKKATITDIGKHIKFAEKNVYTSYIRLFGLEIYYNSDYNKISVKGIGDNFYLHKNGFNKIIIDFMRIKENNNGNSSVMFDIFKYTVIKYKSMEYDLSYYREYNSSSMYKVNIGDSFYIPEMRDKSLIDISYNLRILFELIRILL